MSGQDTNVSTYDYNRHHPEDFHELAEIREQEKLLECDIDKVTSDKDTDQLKADTDVLNISQLFRTPKSSLKAKLCREIQHTRQELYSLDNDVGAKNDQASSGLTLRKTDILNSTTDLSVYFENNDDKDDVTTRFFKGKTETP